MITPYEIENTKTTNRFLTTSKEKAYLLKKTLDGQSKGTNVHWLVGRRIYDRVVIEIDDRDIQNKERVIWFYSRLLSCKFVIVRTMHGYHCIQREKSKDIEFERCKLMSPGLERKDLQKYMQQVDIFFGKLQDSGKQLSRTELSERAKLLGKIISKSGLDCHVGKIDTVHAMMGIHRGRYVLRISKKTENDRMELVI